MFVRFFAAGLFVAVFLGGCSQSGSKGEISGKVTYNGKPLPGGRVTFMAPNGYTFPGVIDPEGNYKVQAIAGQNKIAVDNRMLQQNNNQPSMGPRSAPGLTPPAGKVMPDADKSSAPAITGTYVSVPEKYHSVDASGLTYTVTSGPQTHNIELSP